MPDKAKTLAALKETGVVAVIRADKAEDLMDVGRALREGGVKFIEITMTVPGALGVIEKAVGALKQEEVYIGAGTVLDAETARLAILAGAAYVVSPVFRPEVIAVCKRYSVTVMPGAMTPTEILNAWEAGADVVKVFPAGVGGPQFFRDLKGPLPHIGSTGKRPPCSSKPGPAPWAPAVNWSAKRSSPRGTLPPSQKTPGTLSPW